CPGFSGIAVRELLKTVAGDYRKSCPDFTETRTLNMSPISADETAFVFSYPKVQSANARKLIAPVMLTNGDDRLLALSTLTLCTAENFFLRPSHVDSWSDRKRATLQKAYFSTVKEGAFFASQPEYMLF
ncbi:hypothetical protein, partial [Rhizobium sp. NPDC090279]|uniref:hypothetical protein n=1 Tax=Rhizobium sp. NPDC090279 TaxID=3364499 RepID=UPI00383BC432